MKLLETYRMAAVTPCRRYRVVDQRGCTLSRIVLGGCGLSSFRRARRPSVLERRLRAGDAFNAARDLGGYGYEISPPRKEPIARGRRKRPIRAGGEGALLGPQCIFWRHWAGSPGNYLQSDSRRPIDFAIGRIRSGIVDSAGVRRRPPIRGGGYAVAPGGRRGKGRLTMGPPAHRRPNPPCARGSAFTGFHAEARHVGVRCDGYFPARKYAIAPQQLSEHPHSFRPNARTTTRNAKEEN